MPEPPDALDLTDCLLTELGLPAVRLLAVWVHLIRSTPNTTPNLDIDTALAAIEAGKRYDPTRRDRPGSDAADRSPDRG